MLHDSVLQTLALIQRPCRRPDRGASRSRVAKSASCAPGCSTTPDPDGPPRSIATALRAVAGRGRGHPPRQDRRRHGRRRPARRAARGAGRRRARGARERRQARARRRRSRCSARSTRARVAAYVRDRGPGLRPRRDPARTAAACAIRSSRRMVRHGGHASVRTAPGRRLRGAARPGARPVTPAARASIVDDHELFRAGVRSRLEAHVEVVGEAGHRRGGGRRRSAPSAPTSCCSTCTCPAAVGWPC